MLSALMRLRRAVSASGLQPSVVIRSLAASAAGGAAGRFAVGAVFGAGFGADCGATDRVVAVACEEVGAAAGAEVDASSPGVSACIISSAVLTPLSSAGKARRSASARTHFPNIVHG